MSVSNKLQKQLENKSTTFSREDIDILKTDILKIASIVIWEAIGIILNAYIEKRRS